MRIPDCYDPIYQEERRQLAYMRLMEKRPVCAGCGERILTEEYLDLEPFGIKGLACDKCVEKNKGYSDDLEVG